LLRTSLGVFQQCLRLRFAITSNPNPVRSRLLARARIELGELPLARKILDQVLEETARLGLHHFELSAAFARAQVELRSGRVPAARARLAALAQSADRLGYARLARQARALR